MKRITTDNCVYIHSEIPVYAKNLLHSTDLFVIEKSEDDCHFIHIDKPLQTEERDIFTLWYSDNASIIEYKNIQNESTYNQSASSLLVQAGFRVNPEMNEIWSVGCDHSTLAVC